MLEYSPASPVQTSKNPAHSGRPPAGKRLLQQRLRILQTDPCNPRIALPVPPIQARSSTAESAALSKRSRQTCILLQALVFRMDGIGGAIPALLRTVRIWHDRDH